MHPVTSTHVLAGNSFAPGFVHINSLFVDLLCHMLTSHRFVLVTRLSDFLLFFLAAIVIAVFAFSSPVPSPLANSQRPRGARASLFPGEFGAVFLLC